MVKEKIPQIDGKELKKRRIALNISQNDFANVSNISYRTIIRFEQGKSVSDNSARKIAETLKILEAHPKHENLWWKSHKNSITEKP
ncbi:MAG: helix-turn-helix transcriptional regulator [Candidatus Ratteibacteria bacterium]|nr:helix-turn-helix transcriptional regulator [Candidatus Ratteibacteria bacterium]